MRTPRAKLAPGTKCRVTHHQLPDTVSMTSRALARARLGVVAAAAFAGGLVVAAGFNLTPFGYAQQRGEPQKPPAQAVQQMTEASNSFVSIAEHVTPAVVSIQTERGARDIRRPRGQNLPPGLEDFFQQFDPNRRQPPMEGAGSGFIVSPDGYILTNNHVVADADRVNVTLLDKRVFKAKIVGRDPTTDVALIKIDGSGFPTLPLGDDGNAKSGEWGLASGTPPGLVFAAPAGIISAKGRSGQLRGLYPSQYAIVDYLQTDAAINPGNSGGPLVNTRGEVIGINSAIASPTGAYAGYGFAIPISLARSVMDDLIAHGRVERAALGISVRDAGPNDAAYVGLPSARGVLVQDFSDDRSPAKRVGLQAGDVIIAVDGQPVDYVGQLQERIAFRTPGETVTLDVARKGGARATIRVPLERVGDDGQTASADRG